MIYQIPEHRRQVVVEVLSSLREAGRAILTTHINGDGDGAGSEVALAAWLREQGREAWIINPTPFPEAYRFLLPDPDWAIDPGTARAREVAAEADLAVVLDTGETSRIGRVEALIGSLPRVIIDHHPPGDSPMPGLSLRDPTASAAGELVYDLLWLGGGVWPPASAVGIYVAILTDTGSFRYGNTSPRVHRIVSDLLERGVEPEAISRTVYGEVPVRKLHLLQASLGHLEVDSEDGVAWMTVPHEVYSALSATSDDIDGLVDYPRSVEGMEVALLFRQTARGGTKVSFRSNGRIDVNRLARAFGGGGHIMASGALVERPLAEVRTEVVNATRQAVREFRLRTANG
jgi:phosphoesterase RecJ-like protein